MASENLGPAHPCLGCVHRGLTTVEYDRSARRARPASKCKASGIYTPLFVGDPLPAWCPGKALK